MKGLSSVWVLTTVVSSGSPAPPPVAGFRFARIVNRNVDSRADPCRAGSRRHLADNEIEVADETFRQSTSG